MIAHMRRLFTAAFACALMHRKSGEDVDVLGHSQGGLELRWAIKYFSTRKSIGDYIGWRVPTTAPKPPIRWPLRAAAFRVLATPQRVELHHDTQ